MLCLDLPPAMYAPVEIDPTNLSQTCVQVSDILNPQLVLSFSQKDIQNTFEQILNDIICNKSPEHLEQAYYKLKKQVVLSFIPPYSFQYEHGDLVLSSITTRLSGSIFWKTDVNLDALYMHFFHTPLFTLRGIEDKISDIKDLPAEDFCMALDRYLWYGAISQVSKK